LTAASLLHSTAQHLNTARKRPWAQYWKVTKRAFPTPEAAALAQWDSLPQARARVISVEYEDDDHSIVLTDTEPSHLMWNQCERTSEGWVFILDHN